MKELVLTLLVGLGLVFSGCAEDRNNSSNRAPVLTQKKVIKSVGERTLFTYDITSNVTDSDGDVLRVTTLLMANGTTTLPSGISLVGNNLSVANSISVEDAKSITYDMNATVSDGTKSISYDLTLVVEDVVNDNLLKYTLNIDDTIDSNATLDLSVNLSDTDGLFGNAFTYTILDKNSSNSVIYTSRLSDAEGNGDFTDSINLVDNSIGAGYYTFKMVVPTVVGGETPQGDVNITHNFEVISLEDNVTAKVED